MELVVIIVGLMCSAAGILLLLKKPEYQFEKTTNGKIIKFLDYAESKRISRIKTFGIVFLIPGMIGIGIGIYIMIVK